MKITDLPYEREQLLSKIINYFNQVDEGISQFLGGSLAKGNADEFSDIDFRIVIGNEHTKQDLLNEFLQKFESEIAFVETLTSFYGVFHFLNFVKVDLFIYYAKDLTPNIWLQDIKIIKDHHQFLLKLKEESREIKYTIASDDLMQYLNKYTSYLHELYRRKMRLETNYCEHCSLMMKHILVSLWLIEKNHLPNDLGDWSKYEGSRSLLETDQQNLISKYTPFNVIQSEEFVQVMNKEVLKVAQAMITELKLNMNLELHEKLFSFHFE